MKMNEFMTALQTHLATQQPNYPDNAESILEVLFDAYNESSGFENAAIKADFEELYQLMNGKPLKLLRGYASCRTDTAICFRRGTGYISCHFRR